MACVQYILGSRPTSGSLRVPLTMSNDLPESRAGFVPDLCRARAVFVVVLLTELLVFLVVVSAHGFGGEAPLALALLSLYAQTLALGATAALCAARQPLARFSVWRAGAAGWLIVMGVSAVVAEAAWRIVTPFALESALIRLAHVEFLARTLVIAAIAAGLILRYFHLSHEWRRQTRAEAQARFEALQARIRPHFLFNAMNTIASLTRRDPILAERAVEDLSDLFRASLREGLSWSRFDTEVTLARRYLDIEALRLGERLSVVWDIEGLEPAAPFPPLTLQPLLENALFHGIERLPGGGQVSVRATATDDGLMLEIRNPVPDSASSTRGHGIALANLRQRLAASFPDGGAALDTGIVADEFVCRLRLPARGAWS